jgi:hypothetical protein
VSVQVRHGDMLDVLATLDAASVDSVVTDPPYGLGFMGRSWDHGVPGPDYWAACLRALRPGGHLLAFGGTRTAHRLASAIEDAGFELRDTITWLYGSGFPKSLDVSKAIDKHGASSGAAEDLKRAIGAAVRACGKTRAQIDAECGFTMRYDISYAKDPVGWGVSLPTAEQFDVITRVLGEIPDWPRSRVEGVWRGRAGAVTSNNTAMSGVNYGRTDKQAPATDAARQWSGWGTALKPASEPIIVARKPLGSTVAATVLAHGTGALNIDGCRVATDWATDPTRRGWQGRNLSHDGGTVRFADHDKHLSQPNTAGRWPANVVLTHAPDCDPECVDGCPVRELDAQSGTSKSARSVRVQPGGVIGNGNTHGAFVATSANVGGFDDQGTASRFFPTFRYQAKAPTSERPKVDGVAHPTVKPLALMRWLVRLVTPPCGLVLDPFAGSGTTGEAAHLEGFDAVLVERDETYLPLIAARMERAA